MNIIMLSANDLVEARKRQIPNILPSVTKCYEPTGTIEELNEIHNYIETVEKIIAHERVKILNSLSQAIWQHELGLAEVIHKVGSHWSKTGHMVNKKLFIYPEEALYLMEMGVLEVLFNGVPMSIEKAYSLLLNIDKNITIEKYRVYACLSAAGYKLSRHFKNYQTQNLKRERSKLESSLDTLEFNKKVKVNTVISETNIYDTYNNVNIPTSSTQSSEYYEGLKLDFDFDVYIQHNKKKTSTKSCTSLPNFRVIVFRSSDPMPDFNKIKGLATNLDDQVPVVSAIVFPDHIIFCYIHPIKIPNLWTHENY